MKILFVGEMNPMGRGYQRFLAFKDLGHEVIECALLPPDRVLDLKPTILQRMRWKLGIPADIYGTNVRAIREVEAGEPDIVWIEKGNTIWPRTLLSIKERQPKVIIVSYSEDDMYVRHNRSMYYAVGLKYYDAVFTTKSYNCNFDELPSLGARRVVFVDKAFDIRIHQPIETMDEEIMRFGGDVGFIGTYEKPRAESMLFLAESGIKIRIWGSGWNKHSGVHKNLVIENRCLYGDDYRKGICATRINLCFLRKANRDLQTDRTMEIPACGSFMLAERTAEHQRLFEEDVEAVYFDSNDELLEKVRHYLKNDGMRRRIAAAGRRRCETSGYSHHDRLYWMLGQL